MVYPLHLSSSILCIISFLWTDNFIPSSEDYIDLDYEPVENIHSSFLYRARTINKDGRDIWHQKMVYSFNEVQLGLRMDKSIDTHQFNNQKFFLTGNFNGYDFKVGSLRFQSGNGLLLGSDYATIKSPSNPASLGKVHWKTGTYLGAASYYNPVGVMVEKENYYKIGIVDKVLLATARLEHHQILLIPNAIISANKFPSYSLAMKNNQDSWGVTAESAIQKDKLAQYFQFYSRNSRLKFVTQFRYLPPKWQPFSGSPANGLGKSQNEKGVLFAVYFKNESISFYGWKDFAKEIQNDNEPEKKGQELFMGMAVKNHHFKFDLNYRKRLLTEAVQSQLTEIQKQYLTLTIGNGWKAKGKLILIKPQENWGYILQLQSKKIVMGNFNSTLGTVYFNTDDWSSRVYLVLPGMAGEFGLKPFYGEGISIFTLLKCKLDSTHHISARYTLLPYLNGLWEMNSVFALQLDIVF